MPLTMGEHPLISAGNNFAQPDMEGADNNMGDAASLLYEHGKATGAGQTAPPIQKLSLSFGKDGQGTVDAKLSQAAAQQLMEMLDQARATNRAADAYIGQLAAKRDVMQQHPIITQLGRYASLAATAYQAPGSRGNALVRAAGAYGGDYFRDNPEDLQAKITEAEQGKLRTLLPIQQAIAQDRRLAIADKRQADQDERDTERLRLQGLQDFNRPFDIPADKGNYKAGSYTNAAQSAIARGLTTPEEVARYETSLQQRSEAFNTELNRREKMEKDNREAEIRLRSNLAAQERAANENNARASALMGRVIDIDKETSAYRRAQEAARSTIGSYAAALGKPVPQTIEEARAIVNETIKKLSSDQMAASQPGYQDDLRALRKESGEALASFDYSKEIKDNEIKRQSTAKGLPKGWQIDAPLPPPTPQGPEAPKITAAQVDAMGSKEYYTAWKAGLLPGVSREQAEKIVEEKGAKEREKPAAAPAGGGSFGAYQPIADAAGAAYGALGRAMSYRSGEGGAPPSPTPTPGPRGLPPATVRQGNANPRESVVGWQEQAAYTIDQKALEFLKAGKSLASQEFQDFVKHVYEQLQVPPDQPPMAPVFGR